MDDHPLLVMVTETYPYPGPDDPFLTDEVAELCGHAHVIVVPTVVSGTVRAHLPGNPEVDLSLAEELDHLSAGDVLRGIVSSSSAREILRHGTAGLHPRAIATVARRRSRARAGQTWVERRLLPRLRGRACIVYSWWGTAAATGVARALAPTGVPFVCRMHGYDLYAEQERIGFVPFQSDIIANATEIWTAAHAGAQYLRARYPNAAAPIVAMPIGSREVRVSVKQDSPSSRQVVSCSNVIPVKRLDLLARALSNICVRHPELDLQWTHIGSGALLPELEDLCETLPGLRGRVTLAGAMTHEEVLTWLGAHRVDVFCNVSASEGLPVTLMEAASAAIPLLALDVGGNREVVDETNGRLLPADCSPEDIANALAEMLTAGPEEVAGFRHASGKRWNEHFDARRNHAECARRLVALAQAPAPRDR